MAPWKLRSEHERFTLHEDYGLEPSLISFKLHYNGVFTNPPGRTYKNGSVTFVDGIICDEFCIHDIDDIMDELGYLGKSDMWYHYLKSGHDLDRGLMDLGCDADVHLLLKYVPEHRLVELFIQHGNNSLQVMESIRPNKEREKGIVIIDDLEEHSLIENVAGHSFMELMLVDEGHNEEEEDNEPLIDPHFLHEEIDINMDGYDDKVQFVCEVESEDEVQVEGEEEGEVGRDEEVPAGKPLGFSDEESNSDSDFETSRNREIRNICKEHERETIPDMVNFYIGQAFGGKQEVKDMISELAIQSRRQLTLEKNDKHQIRAVCKGKMRKYEDDKSGLWDPKLLSESSDVCPWVLHVSCANNEKYEVKGPWQDHCVVDMTAKVCTCRRWELTGIPCKHAVAVMFYMSLNGEAVGVPESWVHSCYWLRTWKEVYSFKIEPLQGSLDWPKSDCPTTLTPPPHHTPVGRPSKKRKRAIDEIRVPLVAGHKIRRVGKTVTCSKCKQRGHNSRICKA